MDRFCQNVTFYQFITFVTLLFKKLQFVKTGVILTRFNFLTNNVTNVIS